MKSFSRFVRLAFAIVLIGAVIMTHSDDRGLVLPPRIAATKAVVVPIPGKKTDPTEINAEAKKLSQELELGRAAIVDDRPNLSPGRKYHHWENRGIPIRIELGPRDMENNQAVIVRRDTGEKLFVPRAELKAKVASVLEDIQKNLFDRAKAMREEFTFGVDGQASFVEKLNKPGGFLMAHWCGETECELRIQNETKATIRCIPIDAQEEKGKCPFCGKDSRQRVVFSKAY